MKPRNWVLGISLLTLLTVPVLPRGISAQSLWDLPTYEKAMGLEFAKPVLDYYDDLSPLSSAIFLSVSWPINESIRFFGELPLGYAGRPDSQDSEIGLAPGNPYLGLTIGERESELSWRFGARLPLAPKDKESSRMVGLFSDQISRLGAFSNDLLTFTGSSIYRHRAETGFLALITAGVDMWIPVRDAGGDVEVFGLYGGQAGYEVDSWSVLGGVMGRAYLSGDGGNIGDRTIHEVGMQIGYQASSVQPTLYARMPLDRDIRRELPVILGLRLRVGL